MLTYVLVVTSKIKPFSPLWYIYGVFSNEVDIWNCIEKKYYKMLNRHDSDISNIDIDQYGVTIYFNTTGCDYVKYEIWRQELIESKDVK